MLATHVLRLAPALGLSIVLLTLGCGPTAPREDAGVIADAGALSSGSVCPPGSPLTYTGFGQTFFTSYCTRCHASTLSGAARLGAPAGFDFDSVESIRARAVRIDHEAAAGPLRMGMTMPPNAPTPPEAERRRLGEWLACGAP